MQFAILAVMAVVTCLGFFQYGYRRGFRTGSKMPESTVRGCSLVSDGIRHGMYGIVAGRDGKDIVFENNEFTLVSSSQFSGFAL